MAHLSDSHCRLITAFVDGELPQEDAATLASLLEHSSEARALLRDLQRDSTRVRGIASASLPSDFADQLVHEAKSLPIPRKTLARRHKLRLSLAWSSAAAAVLFAFLVNQKSDTVNIPARSSHEIVHNQPSPSVNPGMELVDAATPEHRHVARIEIEPKTSIHDRANPSAPNPSVNTNRGPTSALPPVFTGPPHAEESLTKIKESSKLRLVMADLQQDSTKQRLHSVLGKDAAFHVALTGRDASAAVERLSAACKLARVHLTAEQVAMSKLRSKEKLGACALLFDRVSPRQAVELLSFLQAADKRAVDSKAQSNAFFSELVVESVPHWDRESFSTLLSIDPQQWNPAPAAGDAAKLTPILEMHGWNDATDGDPEGQGGTVPFSMGYLRPVTALFAYVPASGRRSASPELRSFLDKHAAATPGSLSLILSIRPKRP